MKKVSRKWVWQEITQLHTAYRTTTPWVRATKYQKSQDIYWEVCELHRPYSVREHHKTAAFWIMYIDTVEIYLLFERSCPINGLKHRRGGGYPIYDRVWMCVPKSPLFPAPPGIWQTPFFKKRKVYKWPDFWNWNGPKYWLPHPYQNYPEFAPSPPPQTHTHTHNYRGNERVY